MEIREMAVGLRPREKLWRRGARSLSDQELLALILNTGTHKNDVLKLAARITREFNLEALSKVSPKELVTIRGISREKSARICAAIELANRLYKLSSPLVISSPEEAFLQLHELNSKKKETLMVLLLDSRKQLISKEVVSMGTINSSLVHPREVFEPAISKLASGVVVGHNHPSGDLDPSKADLEVTKRLQSAGIILGIELIDHLIIGQGSFTSLKTSGYF